jgi:aldehyde dehydrogenase (NAD+)
MTDVFEPRGSFIDGGWLPSTGAAVLPLINPASEAVRGYVTDATAQDVDAAVASAAAALAGWSLVPLEQRIEILERVADALNARAEELALLQTAQMGAPLRTSRAAVGAGASLLRSYLDSARELAFEYLRRDSVGQSLMRREPVGVVAAISPWNFPLATAMNKIAPALLAGCSVIAKPAPEAPLELGVLAEICIEAGLPDGVLNILMGGREAGETLVRDPRVAKVSFTGSTLAGQRVAQICAERFARTSLELGGKSAAIVMDDANFDEAAPIIAAANFANSGQACIALSRVLVSERRYDEFVDAVVPLAEKQVVGDPLDETTTVGPLVAERQRDRVLRYLDTALDEGAKVATGGRAPAYLERGFYIEPTVLTEVDRSMTVAQEEIFGPVMSVIRYSDLDDAVRIANATQYGLHGGVFTTKPEAGLELAKRVVTGTIGINRFSTNPSAPFGGVRMSGIGREHGVEGIAAFCETKTYVVPADVYDSMKERGIEEA